jgi:glucarate dehydratase
VTLERGALGAVLPNLRFAADAHYHHLTDDVIKGDLSIIY